MGGKLSYPEKHVPSERTFLVTGANTGIGYETAKKIAQLGGQVVITCRTEEKAKETISRMKADHAKEYNAGGAERTSFVEELNLQFMTVELGSLQSVMEFVEKYKNSGLPLHVLICNAGLSRPKNEPTQDGYEVHFQVNYLSHFLMTLYLLPLLKASGPNSRIVNVSSEAHRWAKYDMQNFQAEKSFSGFACYGNSKLFQIMNMHALSRRMEGQGVAIFSLHPGMVKTDITRTSQGMRRVLVDTIFAFGRSAEQGAITSIVAAVDEKYNGQTELYFSSCKPTTTTSLARNKEKQEELWKYSLECLKPFLTEDILGLVGESLSNIVDVKHSVGPAAQQETATQEGTALQDSVASQDNTA